MKKTLKQVDQNYQDAISHLSDLAAVLELAGAETNANFIRIAIKTMESNTFWKAFDDYKNRMSDDYDVLPEIRAIDRAARK